MKKRGISKPVEVVLLIMIVLVVIFIFSLFFRSLLHDISEGNKIKADLMQESMALNSVNGNLDNPGIIKISLTRGAGLTKVLTPEEIEKKIDSTDIVLVSDVSGSMEWCNKEPEAVSHPNFLWSYQNEIYCSNRWFSGENCGMRKLDGSILAQTSFLNTLSENNQKTLPGIKIGLVDFTSSENVVKISRPDLTASLYINPDSSNSDCGELGWEDESYDDSLWNDYNGAVIKSAHSNSIIYLRKEFSMDSPSVDFLKLSISSSNYALCFINGMEVFNTLKTPSTVILPLYNIGQNNLLACTLGTGSSTSWYFDARLTSEMENLVNFQESGWKYYEENGCFSWDPKIFKIKSNTQFNLKAIATIRNNGKSFDDTFKVTLYSLNMPSCTSCSETPIYEMTVHGGMKAGEVKRIPMLLNNELLPSAYTSREYKVKIDSGSLVSESNETNNEDSVILNSQTIVIPQGKDIKLEYLTITPSQACINQPTNFDLIATIKNIGDAKVTEDFDVCFYKGTGSLIGTKRVTQDLNKGDTVKATLNWNSQSLSSNTIITAKADCKNEINDIDKSNNEKSSQIIINNKKDLSISFWYEPNLNCNSGKISGKVHVIVENKGCTSEQVPDVEIFSTTGLIIDQTKSGSILNPGQSETIDFDVNFIVDSEKEENLKAKFNKSWWDEDMWNNEYGIIIRLVPDMSVYGQVDGKHYDITIPTGGKNVVISGTVRYSNCGKPWNLEISSDYSDFDKCTFSGDGEVNYVTKYCSRYIKLNPSQCINIYFKLTDSSNNKLHEDSVKVCGESAANPCAGHYCGDGLCDCGDTNQNCPRDCPAGDPCASNYCGDRNCRCGETSASCPADCGAISSISPIKWFSSIFLESAFASSSIPSTSELIAPISYGSSYSIGGCYGQSSEVFLPSSKKNIARKLGLTNSYPTLKKYMDDTQDYFGTCICCGINEAINIFEEDSKANHKKIIILLSDGVANVRCLVGDGDASADAEKSAAEANSKGIIIHVIGLSGDIDENNLKSIASIGKGKYYLSKDISELKNIYSGIATELKNAYTYEIQKTYDFLRIIFFNSSSSYHVDKPFSEIPAPLNSVILEVDVAGKITNIERIEIYPVALDSKGKAIIGPLMDSWIREEDAFE